MDPRLTTEERGKVAIQAARNNLALMEAAELVRKHGNLSKEDATAATKGLVIMSRALHHITIDGALAGGC